MSDFFKSLFRGTLQETAPTSPQQEKPISYEQLETMSFQDILKTVQSLPQNTDAKTLTAFVRRFYTIALFDNHVPDEHRQAAIKLAKALTADLEQSLKNNPEALTALRNANSQTIELARQCGCGSLVWQLKEYPMSGAETIPYVMKPEHRHLVPAYLTTLTPEIVASVKHHLVQQLVLQANFNSHNAVLILHGVVAMGDKAAAALFTPDEYRALLVVPDNYDRGRDVLVKLGILPALNQARSFIAVSRIEEIVRSILQESLSRTARAETDHRVQALAEDKKYAFLLTLRFLHLELVRAMLCQIYGKQTLYDIVTIMSDPVLIENWNQFSKIAQELQTSKIASVLQTAKPGISVDFALLDAIMMSSGIEAKSEEEFNSNREFFDMAAQRLNAERVEFLDFLRRMLRDEAEDLI